MFNYFYQFVKQPCSVKGCSERKQIHKKTTAMENFLLEVCKFSRERNPPQVSPLEFSWGFFQKSSFLQNIFG